MSPTSLTSRFSRGAPSPLRRRNRQRGAALVEYAFTFIFSMTLFLGIMEFGHALYAYHFVNNAAKEATRWAAVNGANCSYDSSCNGVAPMNSGPALPSDISTYVQNHIPPGIDTTQVATTATWPVKLTSPADCATTANAPGCTVEITVTYNFRFLFPLIPGGPIAMSSTSEMVIVH